MPIKRACLSWHHLFQLFIRRVSCLVDAWFSYAFPPSTMMKASVVLRVMVLVLLSGKFDPCNLLGNERYFWVLKRTLFHLIKVGFAFEPFTQ